MWGCGREHNPHPPGTQQLSIGNTDCSDKPPNRVLHTAADAVRKNRSLKKKWKRNSEQRDGIDSVCVLVGVAALWDGPQRSS